METGIKGRTEMTVAPEQSAKNVGSGLVDVFATPAMVALMEKTASSSVLPYLEEGQGTVGISLNITHDAATPVGMKVWCESELIKVEGRKLTFKVEAFDEKERIGGGTHERFIITTEKFQAKANAK
ncbi:MAG: thioesterase family protein [Lachnospiraceae bacterium]|nr:thioesterase family protein [Lachnospiraceae bacterium]